MVGRLLPKTRFWSDWHAPLVVWQCWWSCSETNGMRLQISANLSEEKSSRLHTAEPHLAFQVQVSFGNQYLFLLDAHTWIHRTSILYFWMTISVSVFYCDDVHTCVTTTPHPLNSCLPNYAWLRWLGFMYNGCSKRHVLTRTDHLHAKAHKIPASVHNNEQWL